MATICCCVTAGGGGRLAAATLLLLLVVLLPVYTKGAASVESVDSVIDFSEIVRYRRSPPVASTGGGGSVM